MKTLERRIIKLETTQAIIDRDNNSKLSPEVVEKIASLSLQELLSLSNAIENAESQFNEKFNA